MKKSQQKVALAIDLPINVVFTQHGNQWTDIGIVGLYEALRTLKTLGTSHSIDACKFDLSDNSLRLSGTASAINNMLSDVYKWLIVNYYDVSTKTQLEKQEGFYYNTATHEFHVFGKKHQIGLVWLTYNHAPKPDSAHCIEWVKEFNPSTGRMEHKAGKLPPSYEYLQPALDEYMSRMNVKPIKSGLLIDEPNRIDPKVTVDVTPRKIRGTCFLCGEESFDLGDIIGCDYPLVTGKSGGHSFNSMASGNPGKVCWKCRFASLFVPVMSFYTQEKNDMFVFIPNSSSLRSIDDAYGNLRGLQMVAPNGLSNFDSSGVFPFPPFHPSEALFSFLTVVYNKFHKLNVTHDDSLEAILGALAPTSGTENPVEFLVLHGSKKGNNTVINRAFSFTDTLYFFRFMSAIESSEKNIQIKDVMRLLLDQTVTNPHSGAAKTLLRNRICNLILAKRSIIAEVEHHAFSMFGHVDDPQHPWTHAATGKLLNFASLYEDLVKTKESTMTTDEREAAVALGREIGMYLGKVAMKRDHRADKSSLYSLRRTRRKTDFMDQLNRLQFKYGMPVPANIYDGKLTDANFNEFKSFCMLAVLNSYQASSGTTVNAPSSVENGATLGS